MRVCAVIVNWNGWQDTLECLESVYRMEPAPGTVVVCDNASSDGSIENIRAWADGRLDSWAAPDHPLRHLSLPPVPKPVSRAEYDRATAEQGGDPAAPAPLVLVRTGGNLGFAGGTNVGLRYALAREEFDAVWLLNNDTVVRPDALAHLVGSLEADPFVGMVGSTLLYYEAPEVVQTLGGGRYNRWLALPSPVGAARPWREGMPPTPPGTLAYVAGASMLVSTHFLRKVGLLCEDYFLYFEELDWAMRARGHFGLAHAPDSLVYHREGRSIQAGAGYDQKSEIADSCFIRGRILVTRKFVAYALPTMYLGLLVSMLRRAMRGQWDRVRMVASAMRSV